MNAILEYPGSTFLYVLVILIATGMVCINTRRSWNIVLAVVIISIFEGLRAPNVGIDTTGYIRDTFMQIVAGNFQNAYGDTGFKFVCLVLLKISSDSISFTLFGIAFLTNIFVFFRLKDFSKVASYPLMIFVYLSLHMIPSMNTMRQYLASAIVFWACRYLEKNKYTRYLIGIAVATTIHFSSIIGLVFLLIYIIMDETRSIKQKQWTEILLFLIVVWGVIFYPYIEKILNLEQQYANYLAQANTSINFGNVISVKLLIYISLFAIFVSRYHKKDYLCCKFDKDFYKLREVIVICIFALLLEGVGAFFTYLNRLSQSFSLYESVVVASFWGRSRKKYMFSITIPEVLKIVLLLIVIYELYSALSLDGYRVMPYNWNW